MTADFDMFFQMRSVAEKRAQELVTFLTEKCEPNDSIPAEMKPSALKEKIVQIFYENEKIKNGF